MKILIRLLIIVLNLTALCLVIITGIPEMVYYTFRYLFTGRPFNENPYIITLAVYLEVELECMFLDESRKIKKTTFKRSPG
jgi:hypothetical protein